MAKEVPFVFPENLFQRISILRMFEADSSVCVCACVCPLQVSAAFVWKVFASIVPFTLILVFGLAHDPALALIAGSNCFLLAKFFGWLPGSLLDTNPWSLGACWCARKFSIIPLVRIDCF